jgi:hypothetical protein
VSVVRAILIDPERRSVTAITLDGKDRAMLDEMAKIIGCDEGMDHVAISDMRDTLWVDGFGLRRAQPIYAFRLRIRHDPLAGKAIVIGADAHGKTQAPYFPIDVLRQEIVWLGLIRPQVDWIEDGNHLRAVVTYSRVK